MRQLTAGLSAHRLTTASGAGRASGLNPPRNGYAKKSGSGVTAFTVLTGSFRASAPLNHARSRNNKIA